MSRLSRGVTLIAGAVTSSSCIARLGDLRPSEDAGHPERADIPAPHSLSHTANDPSSPLEVTFGPEPTRDPEWESTSAPSSRTPRLDAAIDDATAEDAIGPDNAAALGDAGQGVGGCPRGSARRAGDAGGCSLVPQAVTVRVGQRCS